MSSESPIKTCPSTETLSQVIAGTIDDVERVEFHLKSCSSCRARLDELSQSELLQPLRNSNYLQFDSDHPFLEQPAKEDELGSIGSLNIESEIGRGGAGVVFKAFDASTNRYVAVKVLNNPGSFGADARFERETKAAGNLRNDYLVSVYSSGRTQDGRPYLVMPLIQGSTLKALLQSRLPDPKRSASIVREIALGLNAVHKAGLMHRDVKPANILIDKDDQRAKLTDFGLAREEITEATLTRADVLCGTPEYMSPEQVSEDGATKACDIYALGITLYECLTGAVPFRGRPLDVLAQHREQEPIAPGRLNNSVPRDLETICLKAIEKEPSKRYASAKLFADDLQNFVEGRPVTARPAGSLQKSWRWARRNPRVAILTSALIASLVAGILVTTWMWRQSQQNYREAQQNFLVAQENFDTATGLVINNRDFAFRLSQEPGHEVAGRDLYRQSRKEIDQLATFRSDDKEIQVLQPKIYISCASNECTVGNAEDAIELFDKAEAMLRKLLAEADATNNKDIPVSDMENRLGLVYLLRGEAYHQIGNEVQALDDYKFTRQRFKQLLTNDDESVPRWMLQRNLALLHVLEGHAWTDAGNKNKALERYKLAVGCLAIDFDVEAARSELPANNSDLDSVAESDRDKLHTLQMYAYTRHYLGRHLVANADDSAKPESQINEGVELMTQALEIRRFVYSVWPIGDWERDVGISLTELAKAHHQIAQVDRAATLIEESIKILTDMSDRSERLEFRLRLAQAYLVRHELLRDEHAADALSDLHRARDLCKSVLATSPSWQECKTTQNRVNELLADAPDAGATLND